MSASPYAQRPIVYHFVCAPLSVTPRMWTSIHVPAGVDAFHDATSSVKPNPVEYHGDVHVPFVTPPCGSAKAWKLTLLLRGGCRRHQDQRERKRCKRASDHARDFTPTRRLLPERRDADGRDRRGGCGSPSRNRRAQGCRTRDSPTCRAPRRRAL